ncbi:hypothetical protein, partial [Acinetobacter baumannii]|uniref:hypothetical protein n=1 Tax=Acinetobacter baumannii TaxID=470 RepID=UPI001C07557B
SINGVMYGPFTREKEIFFLPRLKPLIRAYVPFLPIWLEKKEVSKLLKEHYVQFGLKARYSKSYHSIVFLDGT